MATASAAKDKKSATGSKKSSMASAGAEIMAPPPKLKLREKDPLQQEVFNSQVKNFSQSAFITGVNQLGMGLEVSNCQILQVSK